MRWSRAELPLYYPALHEFNPFIRSNARPRFRGLTVFSLDPAVFPDLDFPRLKRSFEYFVEHYVSTDLNAPRSHPVKLLERDEPSRMSRSRRALAMAIADFVDGTQDFCREHVSEIDCDLQKRDAYTLSFLREHFTTQRNTISDYDCERQKKYESQC